MGKKTKNLWLIKLALNIAGKKMWKVLDKKSKNCKKAQNEVLMDIIDWAKDTEYGKKHGFAEIKSASDFQKKVPINDYNDLEPYIKKHTKGEENILFPGKPFIYATTSGTTKEPKWIPITEKYHKECYNGLSKLWFYSLLKENPHIFDGPDLSIVGKALEGYAEDGTPYGSFSGHVYENIPKFLKAIHVTPQEVFRISDYFSRYYCILRFTIAAKIKIIVTGNPSTLLELHNVATDRIDDLIEDIEKGTLHSGLKIEPDIKNKIVTLLKPNPVRAAELKELKQKHGTLLPKHYWPTLEVINTWKCGNSGLYLKHTEGLYPDNTKIREFSYLATEARAGIILKSDQMASILAAHLLFFEFIKKEDIEKENPRIYLASELEDGKYYYIIVTTPSGLYRYNMNDLMKVEGFYNEFPMLRFIQKGAGITSLTGEKLHEEQFISAISETEKETNIKTLFYIGFADIDISGYRFFIEFEDDLDKEKIRGFCKSVDEKLLKINIEYEAKRKSNRIKPPVIHVLKKHAFDNFKAVCMGKGYRDGQFKLTHLMIDKKRMDIFSTLVQGEGITFSENW